MNAACFPWYSAQQPILWWSPDPRMVLFPGRIPLLAQLAQDICAIGRITTRVDQCLWRDHQSLRGAAALGSRHLAERGDDRLLRASARARVRPLASKPTTPERLVGGLYGIQLGQSVLRRIDVQPRAGRLQSGAGASGRGVPRTRHPGHRLPGGQRAPGLAWAPARSRAASLSHCYAGTRGARRAAVGLPQPQ